MSSRRRPGSWQDEVAKGFSRLFSKSSSQEKEEEEYAASEEQERSDRGLARLFFRSPSQERSPQQEEQERSPARLFLRSSRGASAEHEEQERSRGFSRLFSPKASSQEKTEDRTGEEDHDRHEENNSNLASDLDESLSSSQTEEEKEEQSSSPPRQIIPEPEAEKDAENSQDSKVLDSEKQSRENFFHFIGNLFHFSPKSSLGNARQVDSTQDLCKEPEDAHVKNNLDEEDSHQEHTQDLSASQTEQTAEFSPAQAEPSVESNTETAKETIKQEQQETPTSRPKVNGCPQEPPAVTYGTYRGSRRIRKLLKRRPDVNSPIPERDEISEKETISTEDAGTEIHDMLHEIVRMESATFRSSEEEMPPTKIQIKTKTQPKVQVTNQNGESISQEVEVWKQNGEDSSIISISSQNGESNLHEAEDLKHNTEDGAILSVPSHIGISNLHVNDLNQNPKVTSLLSMPNQNDEPFSREVENLKENVEVTLGISGSQEPKTIDNARILEDMEQSTKESSTISNNVQLNDEKRSDMVVHLTLDNADNSKISKEYQPHFERSPKQNLKVTSLMSTLNHNDEPFSREVENKDNLKFSKEYQPHFERNQNISKDLHSKAESKSSCSVDLVVTPHLTISSDVSPNPEQSSDISENLQVNAENSLKSSKDVLSKCNNESYFSLDLSSHNDDGSNISGIRLKTEDLQPKEMQQNSGGSLPISGVQTKEKESPDILEGLQTYSEECSKMVDSLQPNENENSNSLFELEQVYDKSSEIATENVVHSQPIPTVNAESVKTSENVSLLPNNLNLNFKENIEIREKQQPSLENNAEISFDSHLNENKLAVSSQKRMSTNVTEAQSNAGSTKVLWEHESEQMSNKENFEKAEENLGRLVNSVGALSESAVSKERAFDSDKGPIQEASMSSGSNLDNQQKLIKEDVQLIEEEHLKGIEEVQLKPQENKHISEQPQSKVEEMPNITADLQLYGNMQKDIQQHTDENCKLVETNKDVISEDTVDSAIQTNEIPHTDPEIVTNGNLIVKGNLQPNSQHKSIIIDTTVENAQPGPEVSEETKEKEIPVIIEQQQINIETCDDTLNELNLASSVGHDTSEAALVNENTQGSIMSDVKLVAENALNIGSSHVTETARTVSFDNGIECRSPSPTISSSPSSTDCPDLRCDSPLPLSDAIDSGMVSSQAYTPEEHMPIKIFPSEIFNKSISDPFNINQDDKKIGNDEPEIGNVDNNVPIFPPNYASIKQNDPLIEETEANSSPSVEHGVADVDGDICTRPSANDIMKVNLNSDIYVAKVSLKSVNIEEVKLAPYEYRSDIISVSKVESATFEKEIIRLPDSSPLPSEPEYDSKFNDSKLQKDKENIVTNTEVPSDINEKDLTVNVNHPFHKPSLFLDFTDFDKCPNSCYMEAERFPSLNKIDVVENVVNILSNDYVGDIPEYTFLEKGLQALPDKSPDVLIENLKNNNLTIDTRDDIINLSLQTNTSESEFANESLMSDDSHWELQSCDSLSEFHPNDDLTHKDSVKESDVILQSTFQKDVNFTDGINSSGSATSKMSLSSTKHSELSSELFEKKASEIIFSVLHSAVDEFQKLNKNHINTPSLDTVKEILVENHLFPRVEDQPAEDKAEKSSKNTQRLTTDPLLSVTASRLVNDDMYSLKHSLEENLGTNNNCIQTSTVSVNGHDENTTHLNENINQSVLLDSEVNSNVMLPTTASDSFEGTEEDNDLKRTVNTEETLNDTRHPVTELSQNEISGQTDIFSNWEAIIQDNAENKNLIFNLGLDEEHGGFYSKSLETEGSMNTPLLNKLLGESMWNSGTEQFTDPFQFSLFNSKFVEIGSDDESTEEESGDNGQASATDMFLSVPSRRVRIYPLSLSPIYEDDSSCEDAVSNTSSPRHKIGTAAGNDSNDHTSILSLLQSVSDRLKEANVGEMCFEGTTSASDLDYTDASRTQEIMSASTQSNLDAQKMLLEEKTLGGKGLFITKAENKLNPGSGRQSLLLNCISPNTALGAKPSTESNAMATSDSSSINNKDLSPDAAPMTPLSPLQMITDSGLSAPKPEMKCQPRMSSRSVYYQYFHSSQHGTEDKESPTEEKVDLPTERASRETEDLNKMDSGSLMFNPRPGKVILSDALDHENKLELKGDALDATSWVFPNGVNIRVIRGCWILYEKPQFEGQAQVLEEGEAVLLHLWDPPGGTAQPDNIRIGSVKRVLKDYLPEVVISPLEDTSDSPVYIHTEVPSLEYLVDRRPRSLTVNSGVWLTYTEPQYNGAVSVLKEGCDLPQIQACGVKSMRPLKMGGLKVQLPNDPKMIIYEKPHFQGWSREITEHVGSIGELISDGDHTDALDVGSIQVVGGIWVGYEKERYKGYQYLLEEGDYEEWQTWGGYSGTLQSIRYLQANFLEASVSLFESGAEDGKHVDLFNQAIPDLELAGYNTRPQCIHVKKGMWVAYRQKHYCGEQYILEKGRYKSHIDWGGSNNTIKSIRPVLLEPLGRNEAKHLIKAYESTEFQGESVDFTQQVTDFVPFMPKSLKVLRGCWLLCYQTDACENVCVLEEGHFPDLASCGCPAAEIKYIRPLDYVFAEPAISLFALDSCEGRELHFEEAVTDVLSEDLHFYTQSVWVRRGLWIAYENANFLGRQMLLDPQQILNWSKFSGWKAIGSLRPLKQPAVYFMVRNRQTDKYLTVTGKLSDTRATFVSVSSRNGQSSQIWYFSRGFLKSKANDACLDVIGGKNIPGSKVSLWAEHGKSRQKWKVNEDGTISSYISDDLVLDVKGGNYYDQNYLIVNRAQESALTQKWDIEIL